MFFVYSAVALQSSRIHAAVTNYTDPSGYPAAWPSALTTQSYTRFGSAQSDKTSGESDVSKNANPTQSSDFASQSATSIFSYGDGTNLYFRIRVDGFPLQTGSNEPFTGNTWNILFDTDGDGWKEWAVMLHGLGSGDSQPDDIVVIYSDSTSQKFNTGSNVVWRQDSAGPGTNGSDGETGSLSTWDSNPNSYIWDYGRTRVVQIDTTLTPGDNASDYYIDIQAPLAAFDAGGGMTLTSSTWFTFVVTTSASSTDPTGTDLLFNGSFTMSDVRLPTGDVTKGNGTIQQAPIIASMKNTLVCPKDTIKVYVLDALDVVSGSAASSIDSVKIEYYTDVDGDSLIDDSSTWLPLGKATLTAGTLNEWKFVWDVSVHANKNYFVRATAWDKQGNKTVSTSQSPSVTTIVANACAAVPAFDASTKGFQDVVEPVAATSTVRYVLTIRNNGSGSATNVTVRDTLDTYLKFFNFVTGQGTGCTVDSTSVPGRYIVNCALGTMGAGSTRTRSFRVKIKYPIPDSTTIKNKAFITANSPAPMYCSEVSFLVQSLPSITLTKFVNGVVDTSGTPGDTLEFSIQYINTGTSQATSVVVTDANPGFTDYILNSVKHKGVAKTDATDADEVTATNSGGGVYNISVSVGTVQPDSTGTVIFRTRMK